MSLELGHLAIVIPIKYSKRSSDQDLEGYFLRMKQLPHAETVMNTSPTQTFISMKIVKETTAVIGLDIDRDKIKTQIRKAPCFCRQESHE